MLTFIFITVILYIIWGYCLCKKFHFTKSKVFHIITGIVVCLLILLSGFAKSRPTPDYIHTQKVENMK